MGKAQLLDCTLRDGAYLIDKKFGNSVIHGIISGLVQAKIDFIEIGFLQDDGFGEGKTVFKNSQEAKKFIPSNKEKTMFTVLADCSRYSISNLDKCTEDSIDAVRECFFKNELSQAIDNCKKIKAKGYKVFVQPVDILGYSDIELLELIKNVNQIEPYAFSIVDTFGSMYEEDLQRIYSIIDHNLVSECQIGFHSHNNMQMSNALSQAFIRMAQGTRNVIIDGTVSGMGRGAGNTPTELIAQYMVSKLGYDYNMDAILDIIDGYMDNIRAMCKWGYSTPMFLAGCYSSHVNNLTYLMQKSSIHSKDIRFILNKLKPEERKRYPYDLIEQTYLDFLQSDIDDNDALNFLQQTFLRKKIVVIAPGKSSKEYASDIQQFITKNKAIVLTVNFVHDSINSDYIYMSNSKRYAYWNQEDSFRKSKKILTSNIINTQSTNNRIIVSFTRLVKCGWEHLDNSTILLLRLLDLLDISGIYIAGLDGYSYCQNGDLNYAAQHLELSNVKENPMELNHEIHEMLSDYKKTRKSNCEIKFITPSRFANIFEDNDG
ncbi:MAG: aldolase catalytic domain-containing protein [Fibrobacter sp.]|nr:aldolase catalytic domain-containing protein [Fibrobacter sp.]